MKNKETLEEAAEEYVKNFAMSVKSAREIGFIDGAKWQQERMYNEEEVLDILGDFFYDHVNHQSANIEEWFEQFKNK